MGDPEQRSIGPASKRGRWASGTARGTTFNRGRYWRPGFKGRGYFNNNRRSNWSNDQTHRPNVVDAVPALYNSQPSQMEVAVVPMNPKAGPFFGWNMYLPKTAYEKNGITEQKILLLQSFCKRWKIAHKATDIEERETFTINAKELENDEDIQRKWPNILNDLKDEPENVINYLGLAMHQVLTAEMLMELNDNHESPILSDDYKIPKIHARIIEAVMVTPLKCLKASFYNKFAAVKGTVVRVSNIKPVCMKMAFQCKKCKEIQIALQPYGKYAIPTKCSSHGCRGKSFEPLRKSHMTETYDCQTIRLQEIMQESQMEGGRVPRTIECELMYDLVDSCVPGDVVTVAGIVKVTSSDESFSRNREKCMFLLYILANSVTNCKHNGDVSGSCVASPIGLELNVTDLYDIQAIQGEENVLRLFAASLCPTIYGHEMVKAALVLGLIGGTQKHGDDRNRIPIRGDPHILIVGDPGLGKSQMLKACANIAPRGVYVCGNTTTVSGLTVTLVKEGQGGDYTLEAGALVLGDQGCCCIDEFDKMSSQHHALLEAMEQQTISIAKAGMVCSLPARTSILAAGNPVGGHYNKAKTVSENLKMGSALLSRFDLVFILLDKPDEDLDKKLSEHVIALHGLKSLSRASSSASMHSTSKFASISYHSGEPQSLLEKLKFNSSHSWTPVNHEILRKYVAYARKYVHPKLSAEAKRVLKEFYLELRKKHQTADSTPITTRQLESLIRLTEARARIELRETASRQDALDVIEIMKYSMADTYSNEHGFLEFRRSQNGSGMSRSVAKRFIAALTTLAETTYNSLFTTQQMKEIAASINIKVVDFESFVDSLNNQGFLIKKGRKVYQLQTTDY